MNRLMSHGTDRIRAGWYLNAMQTWEAEDYEDYSKFHLWMMGEPTGDERFDSAKTIGQLQKTQKK